MTRRRNSMRERNQTRRDQNPNGDQEEKPATMVRQRFTKKHYPFFLKNLSFVRLVGSVSKF